MVEKETAEGLDIIHFVSLVVVAKDFRSIRGRGRDLHLRRDRLLAAPAPHEEPDLEVYRAAKPAMASVPFSLLIGISSPYRPSGLL